MFHKHQKKVINAVGIDVYWFEAEGSPNRVDTKLTFMCEKCGKVTTKRYKGKEISPGMILEMAKIHGWSVQDGIFV